MDFLQLRDKSVVVMGIANRKSVAYHVAKILDEAGAKVINVVRSETRRESVAKLFPDTPIYVCDVEYPEQIDSLRETLSTDHPKLHGLLHSIAFADYGDGMKPFHETTRAQFLRTIDISCYSLISVCNAFKSLLVNDASVVTSLAFLAKSFSEFSEVRFNAVAPGLLKTSASAGIPGYVDAYLFAERAIPRGKAVTTAEAANVAAFLLSPRSSGINAEKIIVDAGMATNYFDDRIVKPTVSS